MKPGRDIRGSIVYVTSQGWILPLHIIPQEKFHPSKIDAPRFGFLFHSRIQFRQATGAPDHWLCTTGAFSGISGDGLVTLWVLKPFPHRSGIFLFKFM